MFLNEVGKIWARENATWLEQIFHSWNSVSLEVIKEQHCVGYKYVLENAVLKNKLTAADTPKKEPRVCGEHGGRTKTGAPCKNAGRNARCHAHPIKNIEPNTVVANITISLGPDNKIRPVPANVSLQDVEFVIDSVSFRALDLVITIPFITAYCIINEFVVWCGDTYGSPLTFVIKCHLGTINASPFWPIARLRAMLQYNGPWTTCQNESVALDGYFVGDYTPGPWT